MHFFTAHARFTAVGRELAGIGEWDGCNLRWLRARALSALTRYDEAERLSRLVDAALRRIGDQMRESLQPEGGGASPDAGYGSGEEPYGGTPAPANTCCPGDLDNGSATGTRDYAVDVNDLLFFLAAFELGHAEANLDNGSGTGTPDETVDINDLLFFLVR